MKVIEHETPGLKENRVELYYGCKDREIQELLHFIEDWQQIIGKDGTDSIVIAPEDIFYFEAVEKKCFAYLKDNVVQVPSTLQELERKFGGIGFTRINKSMIVNLRKVRCLKAGLNMRMTAELMNDEKLIINRSYKVQVSDAIRQLYRGIQNENH